MPLPAPFQNQRTEATKGILEYLHVAWNIKRQQKKTITVSTLLRSASRHHSQLQTQDRIAKLNACQGLGVVNHERLLEG